MGGWGLGVGGWGDPTGLAAIQALMPICLSSFMAEFASSCVIFQTVLQSFEKYCGIFIRAATTNAAV